MKKINNEIFTEKANLKHNNKYNYSSVNYINCKIKINIICPQHGLFQQIPDSHLAGHGCPSCAINNNKIKNLKLSEDFIKESLIIHKSKYDYSLCIYEGAFKKIEIICKNHGVFKQTPDSHLRGRGCPKCVNRATTILEFIDKGIGFESSELSHIFEPFYRSSNAYSFKGSGIGLSLVEKIIKIHRGKIEVESVINKGTKVTVTLPIY